MIIEFRVTNYRSIAEAQTLSLVADRDPTHQKTHCATSGLSAAPQLLRSAVIYGANASGKSTLIAALASMRYIVELSATAMRDGQTFDKLQPPFYVVPFRFDAKLKQTPTELEVTFVAQGIRYQYGFCLTATHITREWLLVYVGTKPQRWFEREYDAKTNQDKWYFGPHFSGSKGQRLLWQKSTRSNALFLSTATNLNSEQLRPIFHWFVEKLIVIPSELSLSPSFSMMHINKSNAEKDQILQLLQAADLQVSDIKIAKYKTQKIEIQSPCNALNAPIQTIQETEANKLIFSHQVNNHIADFEFHEESMGTRRWFNFSGLIFKVLQESSVLVLDELDSSLHTLLARVFVKIFHKPELNKNNAQLIFSTHNTALLDTNLFRRDQIWFMQQNDMAASQLYPLTNFTPRKTEALEKGYLLGRYGALPFVGEINF